MTQTARRRGIRTARHRAQAFLYAARRPDGFWRDFWTPAGVSDEWVTAFVGTVLSLQPEPDARQAAKEAWAHLRARRTTMAGWGYHEQVPPDADSTQWAVQLAVNLGLADDARVREAIQFLTRHRQPAGGLTTYHDPAPMRAYLGLSEEVRFDGWCGEHPCVSAAAAALDDLRPALTDYLAGTQQEDGHWVGYWWFDPAYTTALATEALAAAAHPVYDRPVQRAAEWAAAQVEARTTDGRIDEGASPFSMAWLLRALLAVGTDHTRIGRCVAYLLAAQQPRGSWKATARLRVPRPDEAVPASVAHWSRWFGLARPVAGPAEKMARTFSIFSLDQNGVFTTSSVLAALQKAEGWLDEGKTSATHQHKENA